MSIGIFKRLRVFRTHEYTIAVLFAGFLMVPPILVGHGGQRGLGHAAVLPTASTTICAKHVCQLKGGSVLACLPWWKAAT